MHSVRFAQWAHDYSGDDLDPSSLERVHDYLLDYLGVLLGGIGREESARIAIEDAVALGGRGDSTLLAKGASLVPSESAAFAHGAAAHSIEMDDVHNASSLHPAVAVIPAAMAMAEERGRSGQELAAAIVAGYELVLRMGEVGDPALIYGRGFHPTAVCGALSSALAAAKLMGLSPEQMVNALGIAWSFAGGNLSFKAEGSWSKRMQVGNAARSGVHAARLAERGATGPAHVLEAEGFFHNYSGTTDVGSLCDGLGERLRIFDVGIKPFACCRYNQTPVDCLLEMRREHDFNIENIEEIEVDIASTGLPLVAEPIESKRVPTSNVEAQFSLPYSSAVALVSGAAGPDRYAEPWLVDERVLALSRKVRAGSRPEIDRLFPEKWGAHVRVKLKDGTELERFSEDCLGDPEKPLSHAQMVEKFRTLSEGVISSEGQDRVIQMVEGLREVQDAGDLARSMAASLI